jgi:hypothetical protein
LNLFLLLSSSFLLSTLVSLLVFTTMIIGAAGPVEFALHSIPVLNHVYSAASFAATWDTRPLRLGCSGSQTQFASGQFNIQLYVGLSLFFPAMLALSCVVGWAKLRKSSRLRRYLPALQDRGCALLVAWAEVSAFPLCRISFEAVGCLRVASEVRLAVQLSQKCFDGTHFPVFCFSVAMMLLFTAWPCFVAANVKAAIMDSRFRNRWGCAIPFTGTPCVASYAGNYFLRLCIASSGVLVHWPLPRLLLVSLPCGTLIVADLLKPTRRSTASLMRIATLAFCMVAALDHFLLVRSVVLNQRIPSAVVLLMVGVMGAWHLAFLAVFFARLRKRHGAPRLLVGMLVGSSSWPMEMDHAPTSAPLPLPNSLMVRCSTPPPLAEQGTEELHRSIATSATADKTHAQIREEHLGRRSSWPASRIVPLVNWNLVNAPPPVASGEMRREHLGEQPRSQQSAELLANGGATSALYAAPPIARIMIRRPGALPTKPLFGQCPYSAEIAVEDSGTESGS